MWPFKSKYDKLKRDDVVAAICELERQEKSLESGILDKQDEINSMLEKGRKETARDMKLFYAKKINYLKMQKQNDMQRELMLLYNINLLQKLKDAVDDKEFIANIGKLPLNSLLMDQKGLARFLNKALNRKISTEQIMTGADSVFDEVKGMYTPNEEIFGVNANDDNLLAMFETAEALDTAAADVAPVAAPVEKEKLADGAGEE